MPNDTANLVVPQCRNQSDHVSDESGHGELRQIDSGVWRVVPARGSPMAALIYSYDVKASGRKGLHDLAPRESELGVAMKKKDERFRLSGIEAGFENVEREASSGVGNLS